jgi:hypothetical protein
MAYIFEQFQHAIEKQFGTRQKLIMNILTIVSIMLAIKAPYML